MDVALSPNGRRAIRVFFGLVLLFLYAPIAILLIFSFNKSSVPAFPLSGFTTRWYHAFATNAEMQGALETSALVAAISSVIAVMLGVLASLALSRRAFRGKGVATALLLVPLVIPLVVLGISLLLLFQQTGVQRSILTVAVGHVVISLPYTILVLLPRLAQIDRSLTEAAYDLGAGPLTTFRRVTLPLILPAVVSAFLIAFTTSFDEFAVAWFLIGSRETFPVFLYSQLRFPDNLPQVIAVAVVVLTVSICVVVAAELWRRRAESRLGEAPSY
jgi:spermidine/putrescine transport system permease protein